MPKKELATVMGFADFVFIPKDEYIHDYPAFVIELKLNKDAQATVQQIKDKKYPASIENSTGIIFLVGISYEKKIKEHRCVIEKHNK